MGIKKRRIRKPRVFNGSFTLKSPFRTMGSQIIKKMLRPLVHKYKRIKSRHYLKKKIKKGSQTKILFICQCQHIWEKQRCVVEKLSKNSHFNVTLLIVPDNDIADNTVFEKYALDNNINYINYNMRPNII